MTKPVTTPLTGKDIIYCCERPNWTGEQDKHYIKIPCASRDEAFAVQSVIVKVRDGI